MLDVITPREQLVGGRRVSGGKVCSDVWGGAAVCCFFRLQKRMKNCLGGRAKRGVVYDACIHGVSFWLAVLYRACGKW